MANRREFEIWMLRMTHPSKPSYNGPIWSLRAQMAAQYIHALAYTYPNRQDVKPKLLRKNADVAMHFDNAELLYKSYQADGARGPVTAIPKPFSLTSTGSPKFFFHDFDYVRETIGIRLLTTPRDLISEAGLAVVGHFRLSATCGIEVFTACHVSGEVEDPWRLTTDDREQSFRYSPSGLIYNYITTAKGKKANNLAIIRPPSLSMHSDDNIIKRESLKFGLIKALIAGNASFYHFDETGE
jgi:hypothetical protein